MSSLVTNADTVIILPHFIAPLTAPIILFFAL
jgi:hypothetical protein